MIEFERAAYDAVVNHAREGAPEEVCGVLAGEFGDPCVVVEARRTANAAEAPRSRYAIDPAELLATIERIEADGLEVAGFYHSHPGGPDAPSATDAAEATWTDYPYVICSLQGAPSVGSWRWRGNAFEQEAVAVRDRPSDSR